MQKQTLILYLALLFTIVACQKPAKKFSTSQFDPNSKNFAFLKETLKDVKILALGESSHGFGSMHSLKSNMIQYLHKELDFDVLILEASYADVGISWVNNDASNPKQLVNSMMPATLRSEQILPLFSYIKEKSTTSDSLILRGMDSRTAALAFKYRLMWTIRRLEPKVIQDSIESGLNHYNKTFEALDNQAEWQRHKDRYLDAIDLAKSILEESREDIIELELAGEEEIDIMLNYLNMLVEGINYEFGEAFTKGLAIRDSIMAENVSYIVEQEFPNKKVLIWGHNGHIEKAAGEGDNIKWLGHYLKERYGDKYYAMGMYAKKGYIYQSQEKRSSTFDIATTEFIEGKIDADYGKNVFVDMPLFDATNTNWVNKPINGYELEAGGQVNFIPSKRFDGVILLGETEAPRFLINQGQRRGE